MKGLENFLNQDEILSHIYRYELDREEGRIFIDVHEILFPQKNKFIATPTLLHSSRDSKYIGTGNSIEEALRDCLKKIKGIPFDKIISRKDDMEE